MLAPHRAPPSTRSSAAAGLLVALALGGCGGGGGGGAATPLPPTGGRIRTLWITLDGIRVGAGTTVARTVASAAVVVPDIVVTITGVDGLGQPIEASAGAMVASDGSAEIAVPAIPRGTDAAIDVRLNNGYVVGDDLTRLKGSELVREGENVVRLDGPGTEAFARATALEAGVETVGDLGYALEEATQRENPEPVERGGLSADLHDVVREGRNALLVTDLPTTAWTIERTQADKDAYAAESAYLRGLLLGLGFAIVDVTDDVAVSPRALDAYDLIVINAYNRETNMEKVPAIRAWMERRRGGLVLGSGVASLLSLKYPGGGDIISAGGNTTYDLAPAAPILGFDRYRNAGGDGVTIRVDDLWRMSAFAGQNHWAGASLEPSSAISGNAVIVAHYTSAGVDNGSPWASAFEFAGEPSATDPGAVNTANARSVWLASEPVESATGVEREGLEVMFRGACLWAVGAVGNLNGSLGPSWGAGVAPTPFRADLRRSSVLRFGATLR